MVASSQNRSRMIQQFHTLGPYLREEQCTDTLFFFDCLAVCFDIKPEPEDREFWGWWMELEARDNHFTYKYHFGLYNKQGKWEPSEADKQHEQLVTTLRDFYQRLSAMMMKNQLTLSPAKDFTCQVLS